MFEYTKDHVVLAADNLNLRECVALASEVGDKVKAIKIHIVWDENGPHVVQEIREAGANEVGVDLKLVDIPQTNARRAAAVKKSGAAFLTVKGDCGVRSIRAAVENGPETIWVVSALTSLEPEEVERIYGKSPKEVALQCAEDAVAAGAHVLVCSPAETAFITEYPALRELGIANAGVRSAGVAQHDQSRVGTPAQAILDGARLLVVGRQVLEAGDKLAALATLNLEIGNALKAREAANASA